MRHVYPDACRFTDPARWTDAAAGALVSAARRLDSPQPTGASTGGVP
jgi:hypothetical protein